MIEIDPLDDSVLERRDLFRGAGTVAAWLAAANQGVAQAEPAGRVPEAQAGPPLPTVPFGKHKLTRLIAGANTIYGYSHFNYVFSTTMGEYHTTPRVLSFLEELERAGVNTWQASWSERLEIDWLKYKEKGGKLQLLLLSRPNFNEQPEMVKRAMKLQPLGIAQHGGSTNRLWHSGQFEKSRDYLKHIRDAGAMVGLSCHNPKAVEYAEEKGWDVDFYQCCFYQHRKSGPWREEERERMTAMIRKASKPCIGFKVLAGNRHTKKAEDVRAALEYAFRRMKPTDVVLVGMWQKHKDQVGENADLVRKILEPSDRT